MLLTSNDRVCREARLNSIEVASTAIATSDWLTAALRSRVRVEPQEQRHGSGSIHVHHHQKCACLYICTLIVQAVLPDLARSDVRIGFIVQDDYDQKNKTIKL